MRTKTARPTKTSFDTLYRQLNPAQKQAVDTIEGTVMVLAGPGTGKTQVLALRVANILRQTQMDPQNILCLTFTESGVAAMRQRLIDIIGPTAYYVRIHTFHSFCNDIIREHPEVFNATRGLEVLSDVERIELFREIIDELPGTSHLKPFANPYLFLPDLTRNVQSLKQEHIPPAQYGKLVKQITQLVKRLKPTYEAWHTTKPTQRDPEAFIKQALVQQPDFPGLELMFGRVRNLLERYQRQQAAVGSKREAGQLRTKVNSEARRWYETLAHRLPKQTAMQTVYEAYETKLRKRGRYDYEDMILFVVEKFKTDDKLLAHYQEQFQYILVDEYQDTNGAQNETVSLLSSFHNNPNVCVVGDDKQSIYRFQGASLENLLYLYQRYQADINVIVLQENYRSQPTILEAASQVIHHNQESVEKYIPAAVQQLHAATTQPAAPIDVVACDTPELELQMVAEHIKDLQAAGADVGQIAVLYRRNSDADELADILRKSAVPAFVERGENILEDRVVQQLLNVVRYVTAPHRVELLWKLLSYDFFHLSPLDILRVQRYSVSQRVDLWMTVSSEEHLSAAGVSHPEQWQRLTEHIGHWHTLAVNKPLQDFLAHVLQESGLYQAAVVGLDGVDTLYRLNALFAEVRQLNRANPHLTPEQFLDYLQLLTEHGVGVHVEHSAVPQAAVRLMTAHKAKGLEFEHVFIVHATDHHWGNLRERSMVPLPPGLLKFDRIVGEENNEDERRLFYVAMTRAKQGLHISYATHNEAGREHVPSLFVAELPAGTVRKHERHDSPVEVKKRASVTLIPQPRSLQTLRDFLRAELKNYVLSVTHLNNYLTCPRLFYYRNVLRVPYVPTKHMAFGTAVHAALYDFFAAATPKQLPTKEQLLQFFTRHARRELLDPVDVRDSLAVGEAALSEYFDHYQASMCRQTMLEYDFGSHHVMVENIPLTGKIDKVEIIDPASRKVNVVDYKTGNPDRKLRELKAGGAYHRQLVFYKLLCDASPRFSYQMASGEIDFIQKSPRSGKYIKKKVVVTERDTADLKKVIQDVWTAIHNLAFLDEADTPFCGQCEFCLLVAEGHAHH